MCPHGLYSPWNSPDQNIGLGTHFLLQGIFPTQGSNPGLPHFGQILYQLSHKGSPRILEWDSLSLLQWIFPTQESNQGLLHCRQILCYQGSYSVRFSSWVGKTPWRREWPVLPHQYSCLENPMDRGALWATVQRIRESQTQLLTKQSTSQLYSICSQM